MVRRPLKGGHQCVVFDKSAKAVKDLTKVGVAIDVAARGYDTLLLEGSDFGKGTSRRIPKLVHGGVRCLEQGNVAPLEPLVVLLAACIVLSP